MFLLITGVLLAGVIFYLNFRSSPKYSLLQIKNALENHDYAAFEKHVDVDATMSSLMDQVFEILKGNSAAEDKMAASWSYFGAGLLDIIKPQLTLLYKPQIQKWVEHGKFQSENPFSGNSINPMHDLWKRAGAVSMTGIEYEKREGKIALIGIGVKHIHFDTILTVNIKMRNMGNYWQVIELTGLAKFQHEMERLEQKRVDLINKPIIEAMTNTLKIANFDKITDDHVGQPKSVKILVDVQNTGNKIISEYTIDIHLSDIYHFRNKEIRINTENTNKSPENLAPQKTEVLTWPADSTMNHDPWLHDTPLNEMVSTLSIESIQFSDGTSLRLLQKWEGE